MRSPNLTRSLVLFLVLAAAIIVLIRFRMWQVHAGNTITVNSTSDVANSSDGLCTLREAISAANNNAASGATAGECAAGSSSGSDAITFSVTGTINLTGVLPDLSSDMTITGPGSSQLTVKRNTSDFYRILNVLSGVVSISGMTVTNGNPSGSATGGGIQNLATLSLTDVAVTSNQSGTGSGAGGGGVFNQGTLAMTNSSVTGNSTPNASTPMSGGGIANVGTLTLTNCTVNNNQTGNGNGDNGGFGGGIFNTGAMTLTTTTISNNLTGTSDVNLGGLGGGIYNSSAGSVSLLNCTIADNNTGNGPGAKGYGGGINTATAMTITGSTISGNTGNILGVPSAGISNDATITLVNSTISGNHGNGIQNSNAAAGSRLTNCTITLNEGTGVGGAFNSTARNSIIAGNTGDDVVGTFVSNGHNLIGNKGTSTGFVNSSNGDQVGTSSSRIDAHLGPLADNGGPTKTHALLPGSPALNAGDNCVTDAAHCGDANITQLTTDQRGVGFSRMVNGTVDIGAYEDRGILVTNLNDSGAGSLRQAIIDANSSPDANAINFQIGLTGTITLVTALPDLSTSMSINGPGASLLTISRSTVGGTPNFRIFNIQSGVTVNISGLIISGGNATGGGGIANSGTLTLTNSTVSGNAGGNGSHGGGISSNGTLTLTNTIVSGNSCGNGCSGGGISSFGTLTLTNSVITGNTALTGDGGGLETGQGGTANLTNCTVSGNTAQGGAGGIKNSSGILTLTNSTVSGNSANNGDAGGILNLGGTLTLTNSTVSGNNGSNMFGAGGISNGNTLTVVNSTITGNTGNSGGGIYNHVNQTASIKNTIVANNTVSGTGPDLSGAFTSQDYNLVGNPSGATLNGIITHNVNGNPLLGPLANNGGLTMTHALLPGSPAINAGDNCVALASGSGGCLATPLTTDQRGIARQVNGTVDIGAFESRGFSIVVTSGSNQSATVYASFPSPFVATVSSAFGEPVVGGYVTFTAPPGSPSGSFDSTLKAIDEPIASNGLATTGLAGFTADSTIGNYSVIAGGNGISPPAQFDLTNLKATTTLFIGSSANPSDVGQNVIFTASAFSNAFGPTGTVQFMDGSTPLGAPVNCGSSPTICIAQLSTSTLTVGTHAISATYSGNSNTLGSSGTLSGGQLVGSVVAFDLSNYSINESDGAVSIKVNRTGATGGTVTVSYASSDTGAATNCAAVNSLASSRCDFTTALGTLVFNPGQTFKSITVLVNRDSISEGPEAFTVGLSALTGPAIFATPTTTTVTINDSPPIGSNAIDDSANFVRQHYHDFLNREPDASGLQFWTNEIESCGTDAACREVKRINVSAAFFLAIEFQQTGYLIERLYKTAYGDATGNSTFPSAHTLPVPIVRFNEFLADTQEISRGVVVGPPGWEQQIENNKVAFIASFVQRQRFTNALGATSNAQFVDTLNANAGNPLLAAERDLLVADLNNSAKTRAQVLRAIAEHPSLVSAEFNRAFVLMQFFGYLRRNPDDPQDHDHTGYDFWLTKLNQFGGNFQNAEMVKAFLSSSEYRQRFGP